LKKGFSSKEFADSKSETRAERLGESDGPSACDLAKRSNFDSFFEPRFGKPFAKDFLRL
jgi:hypothetical protein